MLRASVYRWSKQTSLLTWPRLDLRGFLFVLRRPAPYSSFCTHACFRSHWWSFRQAGHCSGIVIPDSDSNLIVSVVSPVGTGVPGIGQRIMMLGLTYPKT